MAETTNMRTLMFAVIAGIMGLLLFYGMAYDLGRPEHYDVPMDEITMAVYGNISDSFYYNLTPSVDSAGSLVNNPDLTKLSTDASLVSSVIGGILLPFKITKLAIYVVTTVASVLGVPKFLISGFILGLSILLIFLVVSVVRGKDT